MRKNVTTGLVTQYPGKTAGVQKAPKKSFKMPKRTKNKIAARSRTYQY